MQATPLITETPGFLGLQSMTGTLPAMSPRCRTPPLPELLKCFRASAAPKSRNLALRSAEVRARSVRRPQDTGSRGGREGRGAGASSRRRLYKTSD
jgi:hypothetical protein